MVSDDQPWSTMAMQQRSGRSKLTSKVKGPFGAIRIALGEPCIFDSEHPTAAVAIFTVVAILLNILANVFSH